MKQENILSSVFVKKEKLLYNHKSGIGFRKAEKKDLDFLQEMKSETWWGTHGVAIINNDDQEMWLNTLPKNTLVLIGEISEDENKDGGCLGFYIISDIDWIARIANVSGAVYKPLRNPQRSRQAFEAGVDFAFEMLNLHRLGAEVAEYNYPARKIEIDDLGFKIEGIKRQSIYKCNKYYNSIILGLLRSEWEESPRVTSMEGSCCFNFNHKLANKMIERAKNA